MPLPVQHQNPGATYATRDNIEVPEFYTDPSVVLHVEGRDAATGASGVVTVDTAGGSSLALGTTKWGAADTGALAAGTYAYNLEVYHPSAAAANRETLLQHRDAANAVTLETLNQALAGSAGRRQKRGLITVRASERIRLITGSDATNANIEVRLIVSKVE